MRKARSKAGSSSTASTTATSAHRRHGGDRQGEAEPGAWAAAIFDPDVLAVCSEERLDDRQAEAGAATGVAVEAVEERGPFTGRYPGSFILDGDEDPLIVANRGCHCDGRSRRGVARGVVEEVGENLTDEQVIDVNERQIVVGRRDELHIVCSHGSAALSVGDEVLHGDRLPSQGEGPGLYPSEEIGR